MTIPLIQQDEQTKHNVSTPVSNRDEEFDALASKTSPRGNLKEIRLGKFIVDMTGTYFLSTKKNSKDSQVDEEEEERIFLSSPIYPEAYLRDEAGKSHAILIRVFDGETHHYWAMPRKVIMDWGELSRTLLDLGQSVSTQPKNQKLLQEFLMSAKPHKRFRCVDKAGWHGNQYVFQDGTIIGKEKEGESVFPVTQLCPLGVKTKGTLKEWQDNVVSICKGNSRMIFSLGIAFASPCAALVNEDSGGFNFRGNSSIGKTKCLKIAVSVFGTKDYIRSWKTTANALEGTCALYNDALLPLDEFGQSDAKEAGEIAYMVSQGMGKGRMNSNSAIKKLNTWRVIVLSTGEVGLEEHMQEKGKRTRAGQATRFADVPAEVPNSFGCFEDTHGEDGGASFANKIDDVCANFYGTASRAFLTELSKYKEEARKFLKFTVDDFVADNARGFNGQVARVAKRFGLVYGSISLAIKYGVLGDHITDEEAKAAILKCYHAWLEGRGTTGDLESFNAVERVLGKLLEYSDSRFPSKNFNQSEEMKTFQQIWGYKDGAIFYILPAAFKEHFCFGLNSTDVAKALEKAGCLIEKDKEGKYSMPTHIPHSGKKKRRVYIIHTDVEVDGGE